MAASTSGPTTIYIIRHGEKPLIKKKEKKQEPGSKHSKDHKHPKFPDMEAPTHGIDCRGNPGDPTQKSSPYSTSLTPRGWQRAGALAVLFDPPPGGSGIFQRPDVIVATQYPPDDKKGRQKTPPSGESVETDTDSHRPYETVQPLSERLNLPIQTPFALGDEADTMSKFVLQQTGVVLICWEHHHIYDASPPSGLVAGLLSKVSNPEQIFPAWDDTCFDAVWAFTSTAAPTRYEFRRLSQNALAGDATLSPVFVPPG